MDENPVEQQGSEATQENNPAGCSQCSCKMYSQDHDNICTCGHNSQSHTGNNS